MQRARRAVRDCGADSSAFVGADGRGAEAAETRSIGWRCWGGRRRRWRRSPKALREAGIKFRAVDLEKLATRPEVLDALALARAL